jgi:hypothetical protein
MATSSVLNKVNGFAAVDPPDFGYGLLLSPATVKRELLVSDLVS